MVVQKMKTIKTIHGDGFHVYVMQGAEGLFFTETFSSEQDEFQSRLESCVFSEDFQTLEEAIQAANRVVAEYSVESYLDSLGQLNPYL